MRPIGRVIRRRLDIGRPNDLLLYITGYNETNRRSYCAPPKIGGQ